MLGRSIRLGRKLLTGVEFMLELVVRRGRIVGLSVRPRTALMNVQTHQGGENEEKEDAKGRLRLGRRALGSSHRLHLAGRHEFSTLLAGAWMVRRLDACDDGVVGCYCFDVFVVRVWKIVRGMGHFLLPRNGFSEEFNRL